MATTKITNRISTNGRSRDNAAEVVRVSEIRKVTFR